MNNANRIDWTSLINHIQDKKLKMVLEGNSENLAQQQVTSNQVTSPMDDLDRTTLTQLANDLFRRLQDVEEQRREAQTLVSQQAKDQESRKHSGGHCDKKR